MIRFFVAPSDISRGLVKLSAEDSVHIRSLRLRPSELFTVCDGQGSDHICRLCERSDADVSGKGAVGGKSSGSSKSPTEGYKSRISIAEILDAFPSRGEPSVSCRVFLVFTGGDRLDYSVQKSVELGAVEIVLFPSKRCEDVPRDIVKKIARLQRIALEAAKQCGRGIVPMVTVAGWFEEAVSQALQSDLPLFLYEGEEVLHLKKALESHYKAQRYNDLEPGFPGPGSSVSIVTGPAGGFEPSEAELAASSGMVTVTLGARTLRCETAPVVALASVMFFTDNL